MAIYWHGTSTAHMETIKKFGLESSGKTGVSTEKRKAGHEYVFLLEDTETGKKYAEGYAIRATLKFGGEPVILKLDIDEKKFPVSLERAGRINQWRADFVPAECICAEIIVSREGAENMVEAFKSVKHRRR